MTAFNKPNVKPKNKVKAKSATKNVGTAMKKAHEIGDNLDLNWMAKNFNYLIFVTILVLLYISNVRSAEKIYKNVGEMSSTVKELRWEYTTKKAKAEVLTNKGNILDLLAKQNLNLKTINQAPKKMILY